jgi:hypothetical protein
MRTGKEGPEIIRGWHPLVAKSRSADQNAPPEETGESGPQVSALLLYRQARHLLVIVANGEGAAGVAWPVAPGGGTRTLPGSTGWPFFGESGQPTTVNKVGVSRGPKLLTAP